MSTAIAKVERKTLFEIGADLVALDNLIDETGGELANPEVEQAVESWFKELAVAESTKLAGYCGYIHQLDMEAEAAKQVAAVYQSKAKTRESRIAYLKNRMKEYLTGTGRTKVQTADGQTIAVQKNGGKQPIEHDPIDPNELPDQFVKIVRQPDNDAIRKALEGGEVLPFSRLLPVGTHLRIR